MGLIPRAMRGAAHVGSAFVGLLVVASGAWLVIGPLAWRVLETTRPVFKSASSLSELSYQVGYSLGPGVLLCVLGSFAMGWAVRRRLRPPAHSPV
jgi:hypothetical protein